MSSSPDKAEDDLLDADGLAALTTLASLLEAPKVDRARRDALIASLSTAGRFDALAERVAGMLDIDADAAREMLDRAGLIENYEPSPFPGVRLAHVVGGPRVTDAITGFVRIEADAAFPDHDHLGAETVLIVQGSCLDMPSGNIYRSGDLVYGRPGEVHTVIARPGPDLVYLAVLFEGLRVGEMELRPGDPNI